MLIHLMKGTREVVWIAEHYEEGNPDEDLAEFMAEGWEIVGTCELSDDPVGLPTNRPLAAY